MNRLPLALTVVCAAIAIALWLIAESLDRDARRSALEDAARIPLPDTSAVTGDSPVKIGNTDNCQAVEAGLRNLVQQSQSCATDSDCVVFDYGYPIECMTSVARSGIPALRAEFSRYHGSCDYRVYYDCPTGEVRRLAVCRNRRCAVELATLDRLKDETLDHLGLE